MKGKRVIRANEFKITVESIYGKLVPQYVQASNLREALRKAQLVDFPKWFPEEDEHDRVPTP